MPGLGDEVARPARLGLELAPHLRHEHAQVVRLVVVLGTPHLLQQLALGDELAAVAHEHLDEVPLGRREADLVAVAVHPLGREVDGEVRGLDERLLVSGRGPAERGAQPGEQLVHAERLGDVVVGAGVERGDLVALRRRAPRARRSGPCSTRGAPGSRRRRRCRAARGRARPRRDGGAPRGRARARRRARGRRRSRARAG